MMDNNSIFLGTLLSLRLRVHYAFDPFFAQQPTASHEPIGHLLSLMGQNDEFLLRQFLGFQEYKFFFVEFFRTARKETTYSSS